MALGLPTDQRGQIMLLLVVAALAGGYFFWTKKHTPDIARINEANQQSDSLERIIASAKADIASGTLEESEGARHHDREDSAAAPRARLALRYVPLSARGLRALRPDRRISRRRRVAAAHHRAAGRDALGGFAGRAEAARRYRGCAA